MSKTFAIIKDGVVANIAVAETIWPFKEDIAIEIPDINLPSIGWKYDSIKGIINPNAAVVNISTVLELDSKTVAKQYLADTDWYIIRKLENNTEIPQVILDNRIASRLICSN